MNTASCYLRTDMIGNLVTNSLKQTLDVSLYTPVDQRVIRITQGDHKVAPPLREWSSVPGEANVTKSHEVAIR